MSTEHENRPTGTGAAPGAPGTDPTAQLPAVSGQGPDVPPRPSGPPSPPQSPHATWGAHNTPGHQQPSGNPVGPPPPNPPYGTQQADPDVPRPKRGRGGLIGIVAAVALVAGAVGGGIGYVAADRADSNSSTTVSSPADQAALNRKPDSVAGIANAALPSVVTIEAQGAQQSGTGTGFVYDKEGHILTNNHVVAPAADGGKLNVTFSNDTSYPASIVGRAQGYDIAVIKLDKPGDAKLNPLALGNSDQVAVGDPAIAIGAPFGLSGTVTEGIVSAKKRPVAAGGEDGSQPSYMSAIQTDASINPGNSGGPLLDGGGRVVGVNSAIQSPSGNDPFGTSQAGSVGLGFAIPINQAKWVADTLIKTGEPVYAVMGILRNDDYEGKGAQISPTDIQGTPAVTPGGPADKAGLKPGDVIIKLNGTVIENGPQLVSEIWTHKPGDKVKVTYLRDGKQYTTTVTLGERRGDNG